MLEIHTVKPGTLDLLTEIMRIPELMDFNLAGGTSLALQIGHRESVDLDFFGKRPFERDEIIELVSDLGESRPIHHTKNILTIALEGVKVDFVNYKYPLIGDVKIDAGIRLTGLPDIGAMKLAAITGRGRKRDFVDLYFLLQYYTLEELFAFYNNKYQDGSGFMVARSLAYFQDAEEDEDLLLFKPANWELVKAAIGKEVKKMFG